MDSLKLKYQRFFFVKKICPICYVINLGIQHHKKVQVGKDQEKAQSEKKIPTPKTEVGKNQTNNQVLTP